MEVLPVMVTTYEALCSCVRSKEELLWLSNNLYWDDKERMDRILSNGGYKYTPISARNGMFFARGLFWKRYRVSDPFRTY